ncbi:hypothetical protein J6590_032020 [Homalodisca vitripennis]|nr:hypothetical protein J6590_032020 [Homalodisca vitripennis]
MRPFGKVGNVSHSSVWTTVRLGELDLESSTNGATPIDVEVEKVILHPEYNHSMQINVIDLIKLKRKVEFNGTVMLAFLTLMATNCELTVIIEPKCVPTLTIEEPVQRVHDWRGVVSGNSYVVMTSRQPSTCPSKQLHSNEFATAEHLTQQTVTHLRNAILFSLSHRRGHPYF